MSSQVSSPSNRLQEEIGRLTQRNQELEAQKNVQEALLEQMRVAQQSLQESASHLQERDETLARLAEQMSQLQVPQISEDHKEEVQGAISLVNAFAAQDVLPSQTREIRQLQQDMRQWREEIARKRLLLQQERALLEKEKQNLELAKANRQGLQDLVHTAPSNNQ